MKKILPILLSIILTACNTSAASYTVGPNKSESIEIVSTYFTGKADENANETPSNTTTPYSAHGKLSVSNGDLTDQNGKPFQLYGMSTHGIAWFPQYVNYDAFKTLRDDWNTNCVRLSLYSDEYNGYSTGGNKTELKAYVKQGIDYATELGMYVIVDWHILNDQNPNLHKADAIEFFTDISSAYKNNGNILYEICNEPNGATTWDDIKSYANEVIPIIRANSPDSIIIVGTPFWSQEIDKPLSSPLSYSNVMYTLHFYADTHRDDLRNLLSECKSKNLPVFISEFGMCDSSGNGSNNFDEMNKWKQLIDKYNLSYMCWNLSNKNETCAVIAPNCNKTSNWSDGELSEAGRWIKSCFKAES